jgi:endonuclease VIII
MRVAIRTEQMVAVAFRVPVAEFHTPDSLRRRPGFNHLGPSVLAQQYDDA